MTIHVEALEPPGLFLIKPARFGDARGWFSETFNEEKMKQAGFELRFVQDNHSYSAHKCTLRGLHYQRPPHAQAKLVRCSRGAILDVAVDARSGSHTYGQWNAVTLSAENGHQLLVPEGFLHGFLTLTEDTEVQYKCTDFYAPQCDGSVRWDSVGIDWGLSSEPILSDKDRTAPAFDAWQSPFTS